jgi:transposase
MEREQIKVLWDGMSATLNERQKRQYAATLSKAYGYGGGIVVHEITGISMNTITRGKKELNEEDRKIGRRVRASGGGPKWSEERYPDIQSHIQQIVEGSTYGDPTRVLSWTTESLRTISQKLQVQYDEKVTYVTIGSILSDMGYSRQQNQKMLQKGEAHPDRNEQFEIISKKAREFIEAGEPVISVDTKKKENIGNFKNSGSEYRKQKDPRKVLDHDFPIKELGKIAPYGVYCQNDNTGFVNVGTSRDTADFAAESIIRWWNLVGKKTFRSAKKLLITCDCGGSNGYRTRLWKYCLSDIATKTGLEIHVCHFPPGTSKWNKVEHRLFSYISKNWQGKPLIDIETAINLIGSTVTSTGLKVICQRDDTVYKVAQSVSDEAFDAIPLSRLPPFEDWNYLIRPSDIS